MLVTDTPVLSVVVPVYNGEKYIAEMVESILESDGVSMEVLLIDDGSGDGSAGICKAYAEKDERIRYVHQENAGVAAARNLGIDLAKGPYICFADQDDRFLPQGMVKLLQKIQAHGAQMGMCGTMRLTGRDMSPFESLHDAVYTEDGVRRGLLYPLLFRGYDYPFAVTEDYFYGSVWKCIFARDFIQENGIRFERFVQYEDDWIFVTHALSVADCVVVSSVPGYCWRVNSGSESHRQRFVPDLAERFGQLDRYVFAYIGSCMDDEAVLQTYRRVTCCDHYVELVRGDAGSRRGGAGSTKGYRDSVDRYLAETGYRDCLKERRHLKNSAHRKKLILSIISIAGIRFAYIISKVYDGLERRLERVSLIARLERKQKMKSR